jgi:phosphoribosylformylglycinamidine synthase PurS subunit
MKAHVWVMLKSTVLDPQGTAIQQALASLGHAAVRDVRQGKFFVVRPLHWEAVRRMLPVKNEVVVAA